MKPRWKWKNLRLEFGSCFDTDEMLSISSHFKLFSKRWKKTLRAVMMFNRKRSMLYTMIVKSLTHRRDNFEQNARITLNFKHTHYRSTPAYRST